MSPAAQSPFETAVAFIGQQAQPNVTVPVHCDLVGRTAVRVKLGRQIVNFDEPRALGGGGTAPTPGQYALAALGACEAITLRYWSGRLGIRVDELHVDVRGELDLRGFLGLSGDARAGFSAVWLTVKVSGPESIERYDELRHAVDEHSPVLDVFANQVPVTTLIELSPIGTGTGGGQSHDAVDR
jgi:uncharacterized OsmC-like protein